MADHCRISSSCVFCIAAAQSAVPGVSCAFINRFLRCVLVAIRPDPARDRARARSEPEGERAVDDARARHSLFLHLPWYPNHTLAAGLWCRPRQEIPLEKATARFIAVLAVAAVGAWYWLVYRQPAVMPAAAPAGAPAPAIANPVPAAGGALPALDQSDASLTGALADLMGAGAVSQYLLTDNLVRRIVVTVDNLPRPKLAVEQRPVRPTAAPFLADGDDQHATVAAANAARYTAVMHVLGAVDVRQLAGVYLRYYPLFQRAYQDLGYPNGYFNDRLVKVIDDLLATPDPPEPIALVRPKV